MAPLPIFPGSAIWPTSTARWSWWTTPMRVGVMGNTGRGTPEYHRSRRANRHRYRYVGQGPGRRQRRLYQCAAGNRRPSPAAVPAVSVLQFTGARDRGGIDRGHRTTQVADTELRDRLQANSRFFRAQIAQAGFDILPGEHPIVPIMLGDAALANQYADRMLEKSVYVVGFSTLSCQRERRVYAHRFPRHIRCRIWKPP